MESGGGQGLDLGGQAALVASGLVLVEDALVGDRVQHGLCGCEQFGGLGLVAGQDGLLDLLDGSAVLGAQRGVGCVQLDVLAGALAAGGQAGFFFTGFDAMVYVFLVSEDVVGEARDYSMP